VKVKGADDLCLPLLTRAAVSAKGGLFPCSEFIGLPEFNGGNLFKGEIKKALAGAAKVIGSVHDDQKKPIANFELADKVIDETVVPKKIPDLDDIDAQTKALVGALASALLTATEMPISMLQPVVADLAAADRFLTGKQTIAEFAENAEIIQMLTSIGIDYAQGYGISQPTRVLKAVNS